MELTDPNVTIYLDGLYRPIHPYLRELRTEAETNHVPIIRRGTESLLMTLQQLRKPKRILEIGTAVGYSTLCFTIADPEVHVTTLERQESMIRQAQFNIERANKGEQITIVSGDARDSLNHLFTQYKGGGILAFDFVFIDGGKGHYLDLWEKSIPMCSNNCVIVSDNVLFRSMTAVDAYLDVRRNKTIVNRMRRYLSHITNLDDVVTTVLPIEDGVAVSVLRSEHETD